MPRDGAVTATSTDVRRCRPALGTYVEVTIRDADLDEAALRAAFGDAFRAIDRVAALMSFHDPASELVRLNATACDGPVRVDRWLADVLTEALAVFEATDGVFDCTVARHLVASGLLPRHDRPAAGEATFGHVVLAGDTVAFRAPLALDLGGIAKGFAVDRAVDALRARGVRSAVVNAGGDLRVLGSSPVPVHLRDVDGRLRPAGLLADGAMATSRAYDPARAGPAQSPSALIDPTSGRAVRGDGAWSVLAPLAVHADALTKALAVGGSLSAACLRRFGATALIH